MINITFFPNGYEVKGHDTPYICHQVSLWVYITRRILHGYDENVRSYTSDEGSNKGSNEGYSWLIYDPAVGDQKWRFDDFAEAIQVWNDSTFDGKVKISFSNDALGK